MGPHKSKNPSAQPLAHLPPQLRNLKHGVVRAPRDPRAHHELGIAYSAVGENELAERHLRRAVQLDPGNARFQMALGVQLANRGDLAAAQACFQSALRTEPTNLDALVNLGELHLHMREYAGAADMFGRALKVAPNSIPLALALAFAEEKCGRLGNAIATYRELAARVPNNAEVRFRLGEALIKTEAAPDRVRAHLRHVDEAIALDPGNFVYLARKALLCEAIGDRDARDAALHALLARTAKSPDEISIRIWALIKTGQFANAFSTPHPALNLMSWPDQDAIGAARRPSVGFLPPLRFDRRAPQTDTERPLVVAAASADYARTYAPDFIASGLAALPDCDFHLHLMDAEGLNPESLAPGVPAGRLTWSHETIARRSKGVYAARRFLRLPELLRATRREVICVDIDSIFVGNVAEALSRLRPFDAAIYERRSEFRVQQMINASFLAVSPSEAGLRFAEFVASYIAHVESAGGEFWFIDQMAILAAKLWFAERRSAARIVGAPGEVLDWSSDGESAKFIWTAKGAVKSKGAVKAKRDPRSQPTTSAPAGRPHGHSQAQ